MAHGTIIATGWPRMIAKSLVKSIEYYVRQQASPLIQDGDAGLEDDVSNDNITVQGSGDQGMDNEYTVIALVNTD